ncbi:MAG: type II toxin-antitoxin system HicB family antitoxin [Clostridium sp.]|nr:type II toxin-antitoxin system HicB family antitoxin [Clostridium sp.]
MKISYNAIFEYADDGINISFPDIPEAITCAYSKNEAIEMAKESLELVLHKRLLNHLPVPTPKNKILKIDNVEVVEIIIEMSVKNKMLIGNDIIEYN